MWYKLDENKNVIGPFPTPDKIRIHHVGDDHVYGCRVSTIFMGLDHSFGGNGLPIVFETMIFGGVNDQYQERYSTYKEAEEGHRQAIYLVTMSAAAGFVDVPSC